MADRVLDVARRMEVAVDLGSGRGWVTRFTFLFVSVFVLALGCGRGWVTRFILQG